MLATMLAKSPRSTLALLLASSLSLAASLCASQAAFAQGLGELTLDSALNEPLRASIELLDANGLEESQLLVSIASPEEYEQAGLERSAVVSQIEFDIELQSGGRSRVILSSLDRINEPFLSLLVSARWPSGRVLRDYTVLLDLPGANAAGAGVGATSSSTVVATAAGSGSTDSYTVQSGDSLWEIAEQTRPDNGVDVPQMMIAIQRANEDAFVNNNVNRLINGRVLRIPGRDEIAIIEPASALAQINAQNEAAGLMPLGAGATAAPGAARDELSVLGGDAATGAGAGSSDLAATIAALEAELMLSEEDLDRARIENEELTAQLGELEEQISILQNIIAIEDERIAQLQNELAAQAEATDEALTEAGRAADVLAAAGQAPASQGIVGQLLMLLQNNVIFIGAALAVVLAVLGLLVVKARRAADDEVDFMAVVADPVEETEEQGFVARLMARFRRRGDEDEYEYENEQPVMRDVDAPVAARVPDMEVEELGDDPDEDFHADDEGQPAQASPVAASAADDDGDYDAVALASSVLDEVDSELEAIDDSEQDESADESAEESAEDIVLQSAEPTTATSAEVPDAVEEIEFDLDLDLTEAEPEPVAAAPAAVVPEAFEFKVAPAPAPAAAATVTAEQPEVETFAFNLEPKPVASVPEVPAAAPEPALETFEFKPAASVDSVDPDSVSFDEDDARQADEAESSYTPRTNMDECDTKLDLAVAYEAMGDVEGAIEILDEVIAEGKPAQIEEAKRLKTTWQDA
jgi:FimV-like protein